MAANCVHTCTLLFADFAIDWLFTGLVLMLTLVCTSGPSYLWWYSLTIVHSVLICVTDYGTRITIAGVPLNAQALPAVVMKCFDWCIVASFILEPFLHGGCTLIVVTCPQAIRANCWSIMPHILSR
eukprot:SAG31_NODE_510_length_14725_cov_2.829482_1_plen_126_part_00